MIIPLALFAPLGSDCTAAVDRFGIECRGGVFWGITSSTVSHPLADPRCPLVAWGGPVLWGKGLMKSILVSEHPPFPIPPLTEAIGATRTAPVASSHVCPPPCLSSLLACCFKCHYVQEGGTGSCQWAGDFVCCSCKQEVAASCANIGVRFKKLGPGKVDGSCLLWSRAPAATNHLSLTMAVFDRSMSVQCGTFISSAAGAGDVTDWLFRRLTPFGSQPPEM